jgi:hypothetical protein
MVSREIVEGQQLQGVDEKITYSVTTTPWGSTPSAIVVKAFDTSDSYKDVTATVMPVGVGIAVGDVITLPELLALTVGHTYRIEVKFVANAQTFEAFFLVLADR